MSQALHHHYPIQHFPSTFADSFTHHSSCQKRKLSLELVDEFNETLCLFKQPVANLFILEDSVPVQFLINLTDENALGKLMRIAVAKNLLELLARAKSPPFPCRPADECDWASLKRNWKRKQIHKPLQR